MSVGVRGTHSPFRNSSLSDASGSLVWAEKCIWLVVFPVIFSVVAVLGRRGTPGGATQRPPRKTSTTTTTTTAAGIQPRPAQPRDVY